MNRSKGRAAAALRALPRLVASHGRLVTVTRPPPRALTADGARSVWPPTARRLPSSSPSHCCKVACFFLFFFRLCVLSLICHLSVRDLLKVLPGEKVPCDGTVVSGASHVDETMLSGESAPVDKRAGSAVFGSTVNGAGLLYCRVTATGADTVLGKRQEKKKRKKHPESTQKRVETLTCGVTCDGSEDRGGSGGRADGGGAGAALRGPREQRVRAAGVRAGRGRAGRVAAPHAHGRRGGRRRR